MTAIGSQAGERLPTSREPVRGGYPDPSFLALSGLERMRRAVKGAMPTPPIGHLIGLRPIEAGIGTCTFSMPASPWLQCHTGMFAGGVGALASDAALGASVLSGLEAWTGIATSQLCLNFLRPAGPWSGRIAARGRLVHTTRTVGLSEVHVEDGDGRLLAHGTSRVFLQRLQPGTAAAAPARGEQCASKGTHDTPDPYLRPVQGTVLPPSTWRETCGLDFVRALVAGKIGAPPIGVLLGSTIVEVEEGAVVFALPAHEWLCAPEARVYGGVTANLAHDAMACAVHTTLPKGTAYATLDLTVNFLRPVHADGRELRARGRVQHRGRTFAVAAAEVVNADGKVVATASSSSMVLSGRDFPGREELMEEFGRGA